MRRRRYDTEALVGNMRRERQRFLTFSVVAFIIAGGLFLLMLSSLGTTPDDIGANPTAKSPPATPPVPSPPPAPTPPQPVAAPEPVPVVSSRVDVVLGKKGRITIGDATSKPTKRHSVELTPGEHTISAKFGRRVLQETITVEAGKTYVVRFDPRKKKAVVQTK